MCIENKTQKQLATFLNILFLLFLQSISVILLKLFSFVFREYVCFWWVDFGIQFNHLKKIYWANQAVLECFNKISRERKKWKVVNTNLILRRRLLSPFLHNLVSTRLFYNRYLLARIITIRIFHEIDPFCRYLRALP